MLAAREQQRAWIYGLRPFFSSSSFHPNRPGHTQYAARLEAAIVELIAAGTPLEDTGLPANPAPTTAATTLSTEPGEPLGTLGAVEVEATQQRPADACAGIYEPATSIELSADGYAAGSSVTFTAEADGALYQLGVGTADGAGLARLATSIPANLEPPPANAPEDFTHSGMLLLIHADGDSAEGGSHRGIGLVGVADPYVTCDITDPTIDIASPADGATHHLDQPVTVDYQCADENGGSGVDNCGGSLPSGELLDTSLPGTYQFTVTASDQHGNAAEQTVTYTVAFPSPTPALPDHDTFIRQDQPNSTFGGSSLLEAKVATAGLGDARVTYLAWDLTDLQLAPTSGTISLASQSRPLAIASATWEVRTSPVQPFDEATASWSNSASPNGLVRQSGTSPGLGGGSLEPWTITLGPETLSEAAGTWLYVRITGPALLPVQFVDTASKEHPTASARPSLTISFHQS